MRHEHSRNVRSSDQAGEAAPTLPSFELLATAPPPTAARPRASSHPPHHSQSVHPQENAPSQLSSTPWVRKAAPARQRCEGAHPPSQLSHLPIRCLPGRSAMHLPIPLIIRSQYIAYMYIQVRVYIVFQSRSRAER